MNRHVDKLGKARRAPARLVEWPKLEEGLQ